MMPFTKSLKYLYQIVTGEMGWRVHGEREGEREKERSGLTGKDGVLEGFGKSVGWK
jgi:hypothetical protein